MTTVIDGKALADEILIKTQLNVEALKETGREITFVAILVGTNSASEIYVARKQKACESIGINMKLLRLEETVTQGYLENTLDKLSASPDVDAILLQLPLPKHLDVFHALNHISPDKDADGLTALNCGRLTLEREGLRPPTALGVMHILTANNINVSGKDVCVIGRSNVVGKPTALLLMAHDATVTVCHKHTRDLKKHTLNADIIVVAAGHPKLVTADMVKDGAIVIDVGINRDANGKLCGDVDFDAVSKKASLITPVPNGVGPLTIAYLMDNIVRTAHLNKNALTKGEEDGVQ